MTSIVGVLCRDGVVIGTDSTATFGDGTIRTVEQPTEKIDIIGGNAILAGTGQVGLGQRFTTVANRVLGAGSPLKDGKGRYLTALEIACQLSRSGIDDFVATHAPPKQYAALLAFPAAGGLNLCEFALADFQPEMKTERIWYCSLGSAQSITDPFLAFLRDVFWNNGLPTVHQAVNLVTWTLDLAVQINTGGVNGPVHVATLTQDGKQPPRARVLDDAELGEARQFIDEAKQLLREFQANPQITLRQGEPPEIPGVGNRRTPGG